MNMLRRSSKCMHLHCPSQATGFQLLDYKLTTSSRGNLKKKKKHNHKRTLKYLQDIILLTLNWHMLFFWNHVAHVSNPLSILSEFIKSSQLQLCKYCQQAEGTWRYVSCVWIHLSNQSFLVQSITRSAQNFFQLATFTYKQNNGSLHKYQWIQQKWLPFGIFLHL